jgi:hypothetical protein
MKRSLVGVVFLIALGIGLGVWLTVEPIAVAYDMAFHVRFLEDFSRALFEGNGFPDWDARPFGGTGTPGFRFYAPAGYLVGALFLAMGASVTQSLKLAMVMFALLGIGGVWAWLRRLDSGETTGFGALILMGSPFLAIHLFQMFFFQNVCAVLLLPWVLYGWEAGKESGGRGLVAPIFLALMGYTHLPSALMAGYIVVALALCECVADRTLGPLGRAILVNLTAGLLMAPYALPAMLGLREISFHRLDTIVPWMRHDFISDSSALNETEEPWGSILQVFQLSAIGLVLAAIPGFLLRPETSVGSDQAALAEESAKMVVGRGPVEKPGASTPGEDALSSSHSRAMRLSGIAGAGEAGLMPSHSGAVELPGIAGAGEVGLSLSPYAPARHIWGLPVVFAGVFALSLRPSLFLWRALPGMGVLQFPWRWLFPGFILAVPGIMNLFRASANQGLFYRIIRVIGWCGLVLMGFMTFQIQAHHKPLSDLDKIREIAYFYPIEYLPVSCPLEPPPPPAAGPLRGLRALGATVIVTSQAHTFASSSWCVQVPPGGAEIEIHTHWDPSWQLRQNGTLVPLATAGKCGLLLARVDEGANVLVLDRAAPRGRYAGWGAFFAGLFLLGMWGRGGRKRDPSVPKNEPQQTEHSQQ